MINSALSETPATLPGNPVIVIPARMQSVRLPGKPLADINGEPMIAHVWRRAMEAAVGPVVVAAAEAEIVDAILAVGGRAVLTRGDHGSGSDRVREALDLIDPERAFDAVINVQGDLPTIEPAVIRAALAPLADGDVQIGTVIAEITDQAERDDPNVVKVAVSLRDGATVGRALYFSRAAIPFNDGPLYHHIGLYAYTRDGLDQFVAAPQGVLEVREKLEQLRALESGLRIDAALVDTIPLGVDTAADLERARKILAAR